MQLSLLFAAIVTAASNKANNATNPIFFMYLNVLYEDKNTIKLLYFPYSQAKKHKTQLFFKYISDNNEEK
jgi:hypothetical protein